mgnify:CR=1 FL=1
MAQAIATLKTAGAEVVDDALEPLHRRAARGEAPVDQRRDAREDARAQIAARARRGGHDNAHRAVGVGALGVGGRDGRERGDAGQCGGEQGFHVPALADIALNIDSLVYTKLTSTLHI